MEIQKKYINPAKKINLNPSQFKIENAYVIAQKNQVTKFIIAKETSIIAIKQFKEQEEVYTATNTAFNRKSVENLLNNKRLPALASKRINSFIEAERAISKKNMYSAKNSRRSYELKFRNLRRTLRSQENKLEALLKKYPTRVVNLNDIKMAIIDMPNVDWQRTRLSYSLVTSGYKLHLYFKNIIVKGAPNDFDNILSDTYTMDDTHVEVNFYNQKILMRSETDNPQPDGYTSGAPHPHILDRHSPCLGDFLGHIIEYKEAHEWQNLATTIQLFFEQAFTNDSAGKYWPRWVMYEVGKRKRREWINSCNKLVMDRFTIYAFDYTSESGHPRLRIPLVSKNRIIKWRECNFTNVAVEKCLEEEGFIS